MVITWNQELYHYGMPRRSGRYPYGSGKNPRQQIAKKYYEAKERSEYAHKLLNSGSIGRRGRKFSRMTKERDEYANKLLSSREGRKTYTTNKKLIRMDNKLDKFSKRLDKDIAKVNYKTDKRELDKQAKRINNLRFDRDKLTEKDYRQGKKNIKQQYKLGNFDSSTKKELKELNLKVRNSRHNATEQLWAISRYENMKKIRQAKVNYLKQVKPPTSRRYKKALKQSMQSVESFAWQNSTYFVDKKNGKYSIDKLTIYMY